MYININNFIKQITSHLLREFVKQSFVLNVTVSTELVLKIL